MLYGKWVMRVMRRSLRVWRSILFGVPGNAVKTEVLASLALWYF
jgi:hypothetical protein